jgi:hypothetical protein
VNGSTVSTSVAVEAHATSCNGAPTTTFGFSIDDSTTLIDGESTTTIDTTETIAVGTHTIHFKAWSSKGACAVVNSTITVSAATNGITVASPLNGSTVGSPVLMKATVARCGGAATTAFGYSVDNETALNKGTATSIDVSDSTITPGAHTIHFKAWAGSVLCPVIDSDITVSGSSPTPPTGPVIPANAVAVTHIDQMSNWAEGHDPGTSGDSQGTTSLSTTVTHDGHSREFAMSKYTDGGGEIYHISFGSDENATHFVYDNWVYITDPASLENLEMDMNQVVSNGDTIIYGVQCAHGSKTWEYTINAGTRTKTHAHWLPSNIHCDPQSWSANTWHHIQLAYHRDASGNVTYDTASLDGVTTAFSNAVGASAFALGWGSVLLTNFQLDGAGTEGSVTAYADNLTVYRW